MSADRARGRRGQATVEFVLILPLLVLMLVAVADYAHVARETANVQAASSEGAREGHRQGRRGCRLHLPAQVARREGRHR